MSNEDQAGNCYGKYEAGGEGCGWVKEAGSQREGDPRCQGGDGDCPGGEVQDDPGKPRRQGRRQRHSRYDTKGRGDSLAAFESKEDGKVVSKDRGGSCENRYRILPGGFGAEKLTNDEDGGYSLGKIEQEGREGPSLSERAAQVGRPYITASLIADVDAVGLSNQQAKGDAAKQVGSSYQQGAGGVQVVEEIVHLFCGVVFRIDSNDASALYSGLRDYPAAAG